jgi:hypothetical protein
MTIAPSELMTTVFKVGGYFEADGTVSPYSGAGIRKSNTPKKSDGSSKTDTDVNDHFLQAANPLSFKVTPNGNTKVIDFWPVGVTDKIIYLPYYQKNITSTVIPVGDSSVRFFITDELSGCNFFIDRAMNGDLICYHANALQHSPTSAAVMADAGAFNPLAPVTMDVQHAGARTAFPGSVNVANLRVADYYATAQASVDRKIDQGRVNVEFWGGTTIMGFRIAGAWQFWFQTYTRLSYERTGPAAFFKGKEVKVGDARYRILDARRFWLEPR